MSRRHLVMQTFLGLKCFHQAVQKCLPKETLGMPGKTMKIAIKNSEHQQVQATVKYSATLLNISWIAVEFPANATAIFKPLGGMSHTEAWQAKTWPHSILKNKSKHLSSGNKTKSHQKKPCKTFHYTSLHILPVYEMACYTMCKHLKTLVISFVISTTVYSIKCSQIALMLLGIHSTK